MPAKAICATTASGQVTLQENALMWLFVTTVTFLGNESSIHYNHIYDTEVFSTVMDYFTHTINILFTGTLHQSAPHNHYVGIVENQVTWPATVPMRESAIRAIRLVIVPETAQLLGCHLGTWGCAITATSKVILQLTVQMIRHARTAGRLAT